MNSDGLNADSLFWGRGRGRGRFRGRGFTLIEVVIIVAMLVVVAALVAPQFSNAQAGDHRGREQLHESLDRLRTQITIYQAQHGTPPQQIVEQLTGHTNEAGQLAPVPSAEFRFGPYMRELPQNPLNGLASVRQIEAGEFPPTPSGTHGWIYQPATGQIAPDAPGTDDRGVAWARY